MLCFAPHPAGSADPWDLRTGITGAPQMEWLLGLHCGSHMWRLIYPGPGLAGQPCEWISGLLTPVGHSDVMQKGSSGVKPGVPPGGKYHILQSLPGDFSTDLPACVPAMKNQAKTKPQGAVKLSDYRAHQGVDFVQALFFISLNLFFSTEPQQECDKVCGWRILGSSWVHSLKQ